MEDSEKKRIMDTKWKSLEKRGLKRPKSDEENRERAKAAHGY